MAVFKKAYRIYQERGYRLRLLSAAFRNHMHWSEFIGGDVVISPPYSWQVRYNASDIQPIPRMDNPVDPKIVRTTDGQIRRFRPRLLGRRHLRSKISIPLGPRARTLRQFLAAGAELNAVIRDLMVPNPDKK